MDLVRNVENANDPCKESEVERESFGNKRRGGNYLNFKKVSSIFPKANLAVLCKLCEMRDLSPTKVFSMVPSASVEQMCRFLQLSEESSVTASSASGENRKSDRLVGSQESTSMLAKLRRRNLDSATKEFTSDLVKSCTNNPPLKYGDCGPNSSEFFNEFQSKCFELFSKAKSSTEIDAENFDIVFHRLKVDRHARSQLENIHSARAFRYGHTHLGQKSWYKESTKIAENLKTQGDRRKFRIGLKSDVDFLNQLNIMDLESILQEGESEELNLLDLTKPVMPELLFKSLKKAPPMKILGLFNKKMAADVQNLLKKIGSLAHFSQSMANFYALDDSLEPALAVVCKALRNGEDVGAILGERGTFLGLAQVFQKYRSKQDHDLGSEQNINNNQYGGTKYEPSRGFCYHFQKNDSCYRRRCPFKHECARCGSRNHGERYCGRQSLRRKSSSRKYHH